MGDHEFAVLSAKTEFTGFRFAIDRDTVVMPDGGHADRVYMRHPGAVGVAPVDEAGRIGLIKQYRHPVRERLWEIPAGLRDVAGEDPAHTARRELAEEVDVLAGRMDHLLDYYPSPGCSDERIVVFLARDLSPVPESERHVRGEEEADLELRWWPLEEAVAGVLSGRIRNGLAIAGVLAVAQLQAHDHSLLINGYIPHPPPLN